MATQVQSWRDSQGNLHDSEAAADYAELRYVALAKAEALTAAMPLGVDADREALARWLVRDGVGWVLSLSTALRTMMGTPR